MRPVHIGIVRRCKIADEIVDEEKSRDKKRYECRGNMQKRVTQEDRIDSISGCG